MGPHHDRLRAIAAVAGLAVLVGCTSSPSSSVDDSSIVTSTTARPDPTSTTQAPEVASTSAPVVESSTTSTQAPDAPTTIECDVDSGENPTFEVPLGAQVTLVATSSIEREFHLHGYDIELTGTTVTFQFTATLPGPHELTEHPDHSTVCTIVS